MRFNRISAAMIVAALIAANPLGLKAQEPTPSPNFSGTIVDQAEHAPVPRAHVWIHSDISLMTFSAVPDRSGHFQIALPDGYYDVLISSGGFAPQCKKIWIRSGSSTTFNVFLLPDYGTLQAD